MASYPPNAAPSTTMFVKEIPPPSDELQPQPPEYTDSDAQNLFNSPRTPPKDVQALALPLGLPQILNGFDTPFLRAWNPDLELSGIEQDDWLGFIDGLNVAMVHSFPNHVVDVLLMINSPPRLQARLFVLWTWLEWFSALCELRAFFSYIVLSSSPPLRPFHWCIFASIGICTVAQTSARILNKTLTDRYLKKANAAYFEPRGLKVRLMRTRAMRKFAETRSMHKPPSKLQVLGRVTKRTGKVAVLSVPVVRLVVNGFMESVSD